jgi:hypothetical protein
LTDIRYYQDLAQRAETALFDSLFLADQLALGGDVAQAPRTWLEPITVLAAVAAATSRVGLIATASTTYTEPFNLARQYRRDRPLSSPRTFPRFPPEKRSSQRTQRRREPDWNLRFRVKVTVSKPSSERPAKTLSGRPCRRSALRDFLLGAAYQLQQSGLLLMCNRWRLHRHQRQA